MLFLFINSLRVCVGIKQNFLLRTKRAGISDKKRTKQKKKIITKTYQHKVKYYARRVKYLYN